VPYTFDNWTHNGVNRRDYETTDSAQIKAFGQEKLDGRYYVCVQRRVGDSGPLAILYQDVAFPQEGVYRLSFYTHKRLNSGSSAGNTAPTVWWLANTSANTTNWLIRTANDTNRYTEHTVDFYVPSAGTFRLGCSGDPVGSGSYWYDAMLDNVSVVHLGDLQPTDDFDKKLQIEVAAGARLNVCFEGTNRIDSLRLGGKHVHGIIDAKSHPDYISGAGAFAVRPRGLVMVLN